MSAMNDAANELGMHRTQWQNPHGLPHADHVTSARDLATLAWHAMNDPLFRRYVGTVQRGCQVTGPSGYRRNVRWQNTNRLLTIQGFDGIKTGTTSAAGACLVSRGRSGGKSRIVVVLGSDSSDARYVDTRNLFRWSWTLDDAQSSTTIRHKAATPARSSSTEPPAE
jgi:D-alanyl-D-alanine carboxypeptidase (penicillin-binding protein 5/6)